MGNLPKYKVRGGSVDYVSRSSNYRSMAAKLALLLDEKEFTQLFELMDHDSGSQLLDAVTAIQERRFPEQFGKANGG